MMEAHRTTVGRDAGGLLVRVVVYGRDGNLEISEVSASGISSASAKVASVIGDHVKALGGRTPAKAVREVVDNLVHADHSGVVVSVLDGGDTVRVADRGSGIGDKLRALEFGFSGAKPEVMAEIRGVGAGLGIALSEMEKIGGTLDIADNIGGGTVVTLSVVRGEVTEKDEEAGGGENPPVVEETTAPAKRHLGKVPDIDISERQERTLITVLECGEVGPSTIAEMVDVSVSTAYRDLSVLEDHGLAVSTESGKRVISTLGRDYAAAIIKTWVK